MRVGLTLSGDLLNDDGAKFAAQLGVGGAITTVVDMAAIDPDEPIPDGMVWNMRYRDPRASLSPVRVTDAELWDRLAFFLGELVPVAEEAGVRLAAHPDDPPAETLRGTSRLVNNHAKYDRLLSIVEFVERTRVLSRLAAGDAGRRHLRDDSALRPHGGKIAYVHFRNVKGKVPRYVESLLTTATSTWPRS